MEIVAVILNNSMVHQIILILKVLCLLLFLLLNLHQPVGIREKLKMPMVNISVKIINFILLFNCINQFNLYLIFS